MPESPRNAEEFTRDATRVIVGLGLLGFQRAQVKRREIERSLPGTPLGEITKETGRVLSEVNSGLQRTLDAVEAAVPEPATGLVGLTRAMVEDGSRALSTRLGPWFR